MSMEDTGLTDPAYANYLDYHCCYYYSGAAYGECWAVWKLGLQFSAWLNLPICITLILVICTLGLRGW